MREKILLVSMLIFGMGCSGGETQGDVESELRPLIAPKGNLENRSKVLESPTTSSETREILQVNVLTLTSNETRPRLPDHGNIAIPASDLENETPENVTRTESDTIFHTKFFLPRQETEESRAQTQKKHQFFAWPEKFGTSMIQLASYSHRVLRNGEWLGNFRPKRVWHDNIHFRWFIPFFDIFQDSDFYSEDGAHLDDLQLVTVDLLLDSGLRFTYQIKFQVVGPVPELSLKPLDSPPLPDPLLLGDQVSTLGWVIKREELLNPSQHSLYLWLRSLDQGTLSLNTYLRSSSFIEQPHSPPKGPEIQHWVSKGGLKVNGVRIYHQRPGAGPSDRQEIDLLKLEIGEWQGVSVGPGETLVLEWFARAQARTRDCRLPDTLYLNMFWTSITHETASPVPNLGIPGFGANQKLLMAIKNWETSSGSKPQPPIFHQNVVNEWSIMGAGISGQWSRELLVSYSFLSKEDAIQGFLGHSLARGVIETLGTVGESVIAPLQFSCQGILR